MIVCEVAGLKPSQEKITAGITADKGLAPEVGYELLISVGREEILYLI